MAAVSLVIRASGPPGLIGLRKTEEWILISDVLKGLWTDSVKQLVSDNNGKMGPVLNDITHKFQLLDLTVSRSCKAFMREESQKW